MMKDHSYYNNICKNKFPGLLGIELVKVAEGEVKAEMGVAESHLAPNGYLHAGSVVSLADTACGIGCLANLPEKASGFTTIELKSNHLGTVRDGVVSCTATPVHKGRTTQVWDATVVCKDTGKKLAIFRCTQLILYP
ncbi:PaaI family thioesterase [Microbulbifer sp. THAF38]|uniref:PaaI family thioesterase n=1 Tax=Microbulbifer sp. THAF38 TaxID=2587856 RepID=UPI0020A44A0B|nr:PaaI family thioesterase [Microbulbifer sp. THAF38]